MTHKTLFPRLANALAAALLIAGALSGCAQTAPADKTQTDNSSTTSETAAHEPLHVHDVWVKAAAEGEMTAVFGNLHNNFKDSEITIESVSSEVAGSAELHEVVSGKMQPIAGGITLAADAAIDLEPGGKHLMLLDLKQDLKAGDTVHVRLHLEGGKTFDFEAPVRDYSGANEEYEGHDEHGHNHDHGSGDN